MKKAGYNLLVIARNHFSNKSILELETGLLKDILLKNESPDQFCRAHELVNRNRITSDFRKIRKAYHSAELRAFNFLINKN